jgi:hypothetical protein
MDSSNDYRAHCEITDIDTWIHASVPGNAFPWIRGGISAEMASKASERGDPPLSDIERLSGLSGMFSAM